jgi:FkbM family methyltransferase
MLRPAKQLVHRALSMMGIEVRTHRALRAARLRERETRELRSWQVLADHSFAQVLDIGANEGQFATLARQLWPAARIDSFEPLPDVYSKLVERHGRDPAVHAHRLALGRTPGTVRMQQSDFSPSSSILPMAELHTREWPESKGHRLVDVQVERLDDWAIKQPATWDPLLVKIDVQGYELEVIEGGIDTLRRADWLVVEVSFYELYAGQPLFSQVHARLEEIGFIYRGNIEQYRSKSGDRVLFADAIFQNSSKARVADRP